MSDKAYQDLAKKLVDLENRLDAMSTPQLGRSSLQNGGRVNEYDEDGNLVATFGQQLDGTHGAVTLAGPTPPTPTNFTVEGVQNGIRINWSGEFDTTPPMAGQAPTPGVAPLDWQRCEILIGTDQATLDQQIPRTSIESAMGGERTPAVSFDTDYYVALRARATSGKASQLSEIYGPIRALRATAEDLDVDFELFRGTKVWYGPDEPVTTVADLWLKTPENTAWRYDPEASDWIMVRDQGIVQALQDAAAASQAANQAGLDALAAQGTAGTAAQAASNAQTTADSKTKTFRQDSQPSTTGRTIGDEWIETDQDNRRWSWTASGWTLTPLAAGAISATARQLGAITIYRQASQPASGMIVGDYWIDSDDNQPYFYNGAWVVSRDIAVNTAITNAATAQATADGKMRIFTQPSPPAGLVAGDVGDMWIDTDDSNVAYTWELVGAGVYGWTKRQLGNGAIVPQSLVASNVIATGTITAALLEAVLVLVNTVIAGDPLGTHARMTPTGFRVYRADPLDGVPDEVARLGTDTNDYFGIVDSLGNLAAAIDDTGSVNARTANFREDITVSGRSLTELIQGYATHSYGYALGGISNVSSEVGVIEIAAKLIAGHMYWIVPEVHWSRATSAGEMTIRVRYTLNGDSPTIGSQAIYARVAPTPGNNGYAGHFSIPGLYSHGTATAPNARLLVTVAQSAPSGGTISIADSFTQPALTVIDLGPARPLLGSVNRGGGNVAAPLQQYDSGILSATSRASYRGDGTIRTDIPGVVQGWDPGGYNGNGSGYWAWGNLPSITGNVDRVDLYLYSEHWYYNSGGIARLNMVPAGGGFSNGFTKSVADYDVGGYQKPGGKWITLPSSWNNYFRNIGAGGFARTAGISVGPGPGTDLNYYGRFTADPGLRIWYTQ